MRFPDDGTYICTQEVPPPTIQFQVVVTGGVLTKPMTGDTFDWNQEHGLWDQDGGEHTLRFYEPMPPDIPDARWIELDTSTTPPQAFAGTWA